MKNIFLLIYFICLVSCNDSNYNEKFLNIEKQTFTDFKGYSITYRNGIYLVSDANIEKDSNRVFIKMNNSGNIRYIEDINKNIITKYIFVLDTKLSKTFLLLFCIKISFFCIF